MNYKYVDVHCHPNLDGLKKDQGDVIERMKENAVLGVVVGVDEESSREAVRLAEKHDNLYVCVGLHPNYTQKEGFDISKFEMLIAHPKVVGVGECGVDYFRQSTTRPGEPSGEGWKEKQWSAFKQQVEFAIEHDLPLMVHCRPSQGTDDAYEEVADYFESLKPKFRENLRGNMHFFVGGLNVAKRFWALGFTTSFTGVVTFTHEYDEVIKCAPDNRILTETDAPYAAPVPHRGKRNEPHYVQFVTKKIAEIRNEPLETTQKKVIENAMNLFRIG